MKRCPQCRRDYFDETLLYCLDDGEPLLEGPGSEEPATAIYPDRSSEARTKTSSGDFRKEDARHPAPVRYSLLAGAIGILLITALGLGSYFYYGREGVRSIDSIAVMPFTNESGNADIEYLSDGIAETLISSLSQLPNLNVKPRSSAFRYKGKTIDAATLGKELNVQTVLTGTVVQRGSDIGLHIELVDSKTDRVLWSRDYLRPLSNLIALQSEIAREVSSELKTKLSGADERQLAKNYTSNPEAYQLYLKGRFYFGKRTKNDIYKAIEYYRQAVALDPNYALAFSGLADAYLFLPGYDYSISRLEFAAKARENATKALSLDDSLSEAHVSVGLIRFSIDHDFAEAERSFRRAIELDPNNADGYVGLASLATAFGRMDEADAYHKRTLELEPVSLTLNRTYGAFLQLSRRYDESVDQLKKTIDLDPSFVLAYVTLANTYQIQGKYSEAVEAYAKGREAVGDSRAAMLMRESFAKGGWQRFVIEQSENTWFDGRPRYIKAVQFITVGEKEAAFDELESSYKEKESFIPYINVDPRLDPLRNEPRFKELVRKVGF